MKVCLDPGHGINTAGKRSFDGTLREYEFNRDIANRMTVHLRRCGIEVYNTCSTDKDVSLSGRVAYSNKINADIFVSIHANAYGTSWNSANGWEVFVYKRGGKVETLAKALEKENIPSLGLRNRGVKEANFYVIRYTKCPAVLIEHGFYTNLEEVAKLKDNAFREKCAIANSKAICNYFGVKYVEPVKAEPKPQTSTTTTTNVMYRVKIDGKQIMALSNQTNAEAKVRELINTGKGKIGTVERNVDGVTLFTYTGLRKVTITASALNIRKGPGTNYTALGQYQRGQTVEVLEEQNGWYRTNRGWISAQYTN